MNYETKIKMANEILENEIYIDYLKDNINELGKAISEVIDIKRGKVL